MTSRMRWRRVGRVLPWLVLAAALVALWPARFGGRTTFVVVRGTSMQPTYHTGDLVIAQRQDHYAPGEIVVYRVPSGAGSGALIVHRLTAVAADGSITTQGDNRSSPDGFALHLADIVGTPSVLVPNGGRFLVVVSTWWFLAVVAGIAVTWWLWPDDDRRSARGVRRPA